MFLLRESLKKKRKFNKFEFIIYNREGEGEENNPEFHLKSFSRATESHLTAGPFNNAWNLHQVEINRSHDLGCRRVCILETVEQQIVTNAMRLRVD